MARGVRRERRTGGAQISAGRSPKAAVRGRNSQLGGDVVTLMITPGPEVLSAETIRRALAQFQVQPNDQQVHYIQQYIKLLLAWNDKVNLTAIRDPLEILNRHFCE